MAKSRKKRRTHVGAPNGPGGVTPKTSTTRTPRSMVIRMGAREVGPSISQLALDVRAMMEPETAGRLKERRSNRLRDYTSMAGPLGVSHLLLFSRSPAGNTSLRIALTPRGPTLHFRVEKYSLCQDIRKALKHPQGGGREYKTAPLLVMNNFMTPPSTTGESPAIPRHLESLATSIFQSMFPAISPSNTPLSSIKRVLLLNRETSKAPSAPGAAPDEGTYVLNLRHYAIITKRTGMSRGVRRINAAEKVLRDGKGQRQLPNLGKLEDAADYLLDPSAAVAAGFTSGSESEAETDAEVEVLDTTAKKVLSRKQLEASRKRAAESGETSARRTAVEKRAVKLMELGPRMRLRLIKVEEGVCDGKVMWHEFVHKTQEEVQASDAKWDQRRKEKEERKRQQRENVLRKRQANGSNDAEDAEEMLSDDDWDDEDVDMEVAEEATEQT